MYESYLVLETFMLHLKSFEYKTIQYCIRDSSVLLSVTWRHFKSPLTSNPPLLSRTLRLHNIAICVSSWRNTLSTGFAVMYEDVTTVRLLFLTQRIGCLIV